MILTIPDEICEKFLPALAVKTPNNIQAAIIQALRGLVERGLNQNGFLVLDREQVSFLKEIFGPFEGSNDLVNRMRRNCSLRVQGKEYLLTSEQMARLKQEAFFHRNNGEPRSEADCKTPELAEKIISRYVIRQIDYFMKQMCSQI